MFGIFKDEAVEDVVEYAREAREALFADGQRFDHGREGDTIVSFTHHVTPIVVVLPSTDGTLKIAFLKSSVNFLCRGKAFFDKIPV